jgi:hypothetical protein
VRRVFLICAAMTVIAVTDHAVAAPEEIQVYLNDVNAPREFGLEMHVNYVVDGPRTAAYAGQLPPNHVLQVTPEFSYGIAKNWDAGLYLLSTLGPGGNFDANGAKLRLKYIAPTEGAFFWGMNVEFGYTSRRVTENYVNTELRPILGWHSGPWVIALNPIIAAALSGDVSRAPTFAPALKIARSIGAGTQLGIEHYADMGPLHHTLPLNQQDHVLYGVLDLQKGPIDVNFGVGRGLTSASEKWVLKMIVGIPFK